MSSATESGSNVNAATGAVGAAGAVEAAGAQGAVGAVGAVGAAAAAAADRKAPERRPGAVRKGSGSCPRRYRRSAGEGLD